MNLPNLHPAVVHFPIALWFAALLFDLACLLLKRHRWLDYSAATLYALGAAGAGAAYMAGEEAEDSLRDLPASLEKLVEEHSDAAWWTLAVFIGVAGLRLIVLWWNGRAPERRLDAARWIVLLAALGGAGAIFRTADLGGALVYRHGVAVSAGAAAATPAAPASRSPAGSIATGGAPEASAGASLSRGKDGSIRWKPGPGDAAALGTILMPASGSDPSAVAAEPGSPGTAGEGLSLRIAGRAMLLLPGSFGDVQAEAVVDLSGFDGAVGLAHHARAAGDAGAFQLSTQGAASLVDIEEGAVRKLDSGETTLTDQPIRLTVSSAGRHLKGMVDGKVVVHGHEPPAASGSVGLLVDGKGTLKLISIEVQPLREAGHDGD